MLRNHYKQYRCNSISQTMARKRAPHHALKLFTAFFSRFYSLASIRVPFSFFAPIQLCNVCSQKFSIRIGSIALHCAMFRFNIFLHLFCQLIFCSHSNLIYFIQQSNASNIQSIIDFVMVLLHPQHI